MQYAIPAQLDPGEPCRNIAAKAQGNHATDDPPDARTNAQATGVWGGPGIHVDRAEADAGCEHAEQKLHGDNKDHAAEDGGPRDTAMRVDSAADYGRRCTKYRRISRERIAVVGSRHVISPKAEFRSARHTPDRRTCLLNG